MTKKFNPAFESIRNGLLEARDHARGKKIGARVHEVRVETPDVTAIRAKTGLSRRAMFSILIGRVGACKLQNPARSRRRTGGGSLFVFATRGSRWRAGR